MIQDAAATVRDDESAREAVAREPRCSCGRFYSHLTADLPEFRKSKP